MIFETLANTIFPVQQPGVQNFVSVKNYSVLTENFNSCNEKFLQTKTFHLEPPAERWKAMLWRVKQHCLFGDVYHLQKNNAQSIT